MSQTLPCRLCANPCEERKSLYDKNGLGNDLYEIISEHFHPKILDLMKAKHLDGICLECWHHITDFHDFQMAVLVAQTEIYECMDSEMATCTTENVVETKPEDEELEKDKNNMLTYDGQGSTNAVVSAGHDLLNTDKAFVIIHDKELLGNMDNKPRNSDKTSTTTAVAVGSCISQKLLTLERTSSPGQTVTVQTTTAAATESNDDEDDEIGILNSKTKLACKYFGRVMCKDNKHRFECHSCHNTFNRFKDIKSHIENMHWQDGDNFECLEGQIYKLDFDYDNKERIFRCKLCKKPFLFKHNLVQHMAFQHWKVALVYSACYICKNHYYSKPGLTLHNALFHKAKKYVKSKIKIEKTAPAVATKDNATFSKVFKCYECGQTFDKAKVLGVHRSVHMLNTQVWNLYKDNTLTEQKNRSFSCLFCSKTFPSLFARNRHHKTKHPRDELKQPIQCNAIEANDVETSSNISSSLSNNKI